jgi:hypothetical protein
MGTSPVKHETKVKPLGAEKYSPWTLSGPPENIQPDKAGRFPLGENCPTDKDTAQDQNVGASPDRKNLSTFAELAPRPAVREKTGHRHEAFEAITPAHRHAPGRDPGVAFNGPQACPFVSRRTPRCSATGTISQRHSFAAASACGRQFERKGETRAARRIERRTSRAGASP